MRLCYCIYCSDLKRNVISEFVSLIQMGICLRAARQTTYLTVSHIIFCVFYSLLRYSMSIILNQFRLLLVLTGNSNNTIYLKLSYDNDNGNVRLCYVY